MVHGMLPTQPDALDAPRDLTSNVLGDIPGWRTRRALVLLLHPVQDLLLLLIELLGGDQTLFKHRLELPEHDDWIS